MLVAASEHQELGVGLAERLARQPHVQRAPCGHHGRHRRGGACTRAHTVPVARGDVEDIDVMGAAPVRDVLKLWVSAGHVAPKHDDSGAVVIRPALVVPDGSGRTAVGVDLAPHDTRAFGVTERQQRQPEQTAAHRRAAFLIRRRPVVVAFASARAAVARAAENQDAWECGRRAGGQCSPGGRGDDGARVPHAALRPSGAFDELGDANRAPADVDDEHVEVWQWTARPPAANHGDKMADGTGGVSGGVDDRLEVVRCLSNQIGSQAVGVAELVASKGRPKASSVEARSV